MGAIDTIYEINGYRDRDDGEEWYDWEIRHDEYVCQNCVSSGYFQTLDAAIAGMREFESIYLRGEKKPKRKLRYTIWARQSANLKWSAYVMFKSAKFGSMSPSKLRFWDDQHQTKRKAVAYARELAQKYLKNCIEVKK